MNVWSVVLGFIEGFGLLLSPCILPILPIILATSLTGSKRRPIGITLGFVFCFSLVAFFSRQLVVYAHIDLNLIRYVSYCLLLLLGLVMLSTRLTLFWERLLSRVQGQGLYWGGLRKEGFWSGFVFGGFISFVWVPCAGPILAAVIVQTVIQQANWMSFLVLLAFAIGAALPMFLIVVYGKFILAQLDFSKSRYSFIRKLLGAVIMLSVIWMVVSEDYVGQTTIATSTKTALSLQQGLYRPYPAPALSDLTNWINSSERTLSSLRGQVVLIDFWTYSCVNCVRTIPYLNAFYAQYHSQGLEIIGVHAPEFVFERDPVRVEAAVKANGIRYPVALDNHFSTWLQYNNHYWPAQYLIDQTGNVVYEHFGEGAEDILENNIRYLLHAKGRVTAHEPPDRGISKSALSPETYLGSARSDAHHRPTRYIIEQPIFYAMPTVLDKDAWGLAGHWQIWPDRIVALQSDVALKMHFNARSVYLVMGSEGQRPIQVSIWLNGKILTKNQGKEVTNGLVQVQEHTLYEVLHLDQVEDGVLEIRADSPGLAIYTITFGG